jgi:transglutaminase-like putative cysteine protease
MSPYLALRVATYLLAADGLVALRLAGLIGPVVTALVAGAVVVTWWADRLVPRGLRDARWGQALTVGVALASAGDLLYLAATLLDGLVRLLLFLLLYRLGTRRSLGDARDVGFLAFFMLVAASSVAFDLAFLFVFVAFLMVGVWAFMLHHVLSEAERTDTVADLAASGRGLGRALLGLSVVASAGTLVVTTAFFFVIPRVGQAALPLRARLGGMVSGFSERVELGAFGEIETDATVVMRVRFPEGPLEPERLPNLRWRGIALDHFDGRAWRVRRPERRVLARPAGTPFPISRYRGVGPVVTQEVFLEPLGTDVLFAAPRLLTLALGADAIAVDDMAGVTVASPGARLSYMARSELESPPTAGAFDQPVLEPGARARYLQLPPLAPRVGELARRVSAGARGPAAAAGRLTAFLSREYRYTLALARHTALDPVEEFLFVRRAGNCEYFATALAVMLRAAGIPARLVNGFQRGDWNPYGGYMMVRQRDAHSWVEAHIEGVGWITLDPSPRAAAATLSGPGRLGLYLDALRLRWYRYVVNWSLRDQMMMAIAFNREVAIWQQRLGRVGGRPQLGQPSPAWPAAIALIAIGIVAWRACRGLGRAGATLRPPRPYARALRILARRGLEPAASETAREFLARVGGAEPALAAPLAALTAAYERARFGVAAPLEERALQACLRELERSLDRRRPR